MKINFKENTNGSKLVVFLILVIISIIAFSIVSMILIKPLFGINVFTNPNFSQNLSDPNNVAALKFMQLLNSLGTFFAPCVLFLLLATKNYKEFAKLKFKTVPIFYLLIPILMLSSVPLINLMAELNMQMKLPSSLKSLEDWMMAYEKSAEVMTKAFLQMDSINSLLYNIFLIAIIPAIGEELLFRGILQKLLIKTTNNVHVGIWIAAIIFSALHMQFYGFLPRMAMGVLFGYLLIWSNTLWIPILAHFLNNGTAVLTTYLIQHKIIESDIESMGSNTNDLMFNLASTLVVSLLLFFIYSNRINKPIEKA